MMIDCNIVFVANIPQQNEQRRRLATRIIAQPVCLFVYAYIKNVFVFFMTCPKNYVISEAFSKKVKYHKMHPIKYVGFNRSYPLFSFLACMQEEISSHATGSTTLGVNNVIQAPDGMECRSVFDLPSIH